METTGELAWFRGELLRSLVRPREFARSLADEHYGLAGVLVAIVAGMAFSVAIDLLVLASKGLAPGAFLNQIVLDSFFLGVRLTVSAALVATVALIPVRVLWRDSASIDQVFTALTFALVPLLLLPIPALVVAIAPETVAVCGAVCIVVALRALAGLGLNLRAILPLPLAAVALVVALASGAIVLGDQLSRVRFTAYAIAPNQLLAPLGASPAGGKRWDLDGFDLTLPTDWKNATSGASGEAARFESATATLVVARARGAALSTADSYADTLAIPERRGLENQWRERSVVRVNGLVVVDDRYGGTYDGRRVVERQFTTVPGAQGLALLYRVVEPASQEAALAEAASIAATWHVGGG